MKIRSVEELTEALANDLKTRKREMSSVKVSVLGARDHQKGVLLRAGFVMLYAHLEGFVRTAGTVYLSFVKHRGLTYNQLSENFVAVALKTKIEVLGEVKKATVVTEVIRQLLRGGTEKAEINWSGEVDCRNNLSSEVLNEITCLLGLTFTAYETRRHFFDNSLLFNRNGIAHGELLQIDQETFMAAHEAVIGLIEQFRTDIENAAVTEGYKRSVGG